MNIWNLISCANWAMDSYYFPLKLPLSHTQVTQGQRLFWVSRSDNWWISGPHPRLCKNMGVHMNSLFTYSRIKNKGWAFSSQQRERLAKPADPPFPRLPCLHNQHTHMFMYVQSRGPQTAPAGFICRTTNQSCVYVFVWVFEYATVAVISLQLLNYGLLC